MAKIEISISPNLKTEVQTPIGAIKYQKKIDCIKEDEKTCHEAVVSFLEKCRELNEGNETICHVLKEAIRFIESGNLSKGPYGGNFSKGFLQIITINDNWNI